MDNEGVADESLWVADGWGVAEGVSGWPLFF